jgi:aminoglycoside 6'-N-acetyltransferase
MELQKELYLMHITFTKLQKEHFILLLQWLYEPHVRAWWDKNVAWTDELIEKKYIPYTKGYKILGNIKKPIHAFIIQVEDVPVGYIQYYNKYDFPPEQGYEVEGLSDSLAAIDFYIGEKEYLGKGIGAEAIQLFLKEYVFKKFDACFVDPDTANKAAISTYEKAGFSLVKEMPELAVMWMVALK